MNHLVSLDTQAGELGKILSGTKSMLLKELDPARPAGQAVNPGDSLYFLRDKDECALRVKATVVRVQVLTNRMDEDLPHTLKEMQLKLQLTEDQYNDWSAKNQVILVEFGAAQKIPVIQVAARMISDRSGWLAFEDFNQITGEKATHEHFTCSPGSRKGHTYVK